jgi:nucleotide-binding universal stress UspA family protein
LGLGGSPSFQRALEHAIDLARAGGGTLTLMTVAPPVATYVTVTADRVQGRGHAGPEILDELKRGGYDLIVLGTRGRGRTQEGLLGSVKGYIHFHDQIPLLSVPDKADD